MPDNAVTSCSECGKSGKLTDGFCEHCLAERNLFDATKPKKGWGDPDKDRDDELSEEDIKRRERKKQAYVSKENTGTDPLAQPRRATGRGVAEDQNILGRS